jgi:hypothetical protein
LADINRLTAVQMRFVSIGGETRRERENRKLNNWGEFIDIYTGIYIHK